MKSLSLLSLPIIAANIIFQLGTASANQKQHQPHQQQQVLKLNTAMADDESRIQDNSGEADRVGVPGHNNAFYGPVPEKDQIFVVDYLEIAPSPIPVDKFFFVLLRGEIPSSHAKDITAEQLAAATVNITMSVTRPSDQVVEKSNKDSTSYTIPLRTAELADEAHLAVRDAKGRYVDSLTAPGTGRNDIITDYWIPGMFVEKGTWKFEVVAGLEDGRCLFAISVEQWLEGAR